MLGNLKAASAQTTTGGSYFCKWILIVTCGGTDLLLLFMIQCQRVSQQANHNQSYMERREMSNKHLNETKNYRYLLRSFCTHPKSFLAKHDEMKEGFIDGKISEQVCRSQSFPRSLSLSGVAGVKGTLLHSAVKLFCARFHQRSDGECQCGSVQADTFRVLQAELLSSISSRRCRCLRSSSDLPRRGQPRMIFILLFM